MRLEETVQAEHCIDSSKNSCCLYKFWMFTVEHGGREVLAWQARAHAASGAELARRDFSMDAPRRAAFTDG
jgi:hypothetical protein